MNSYSHQLPHSRILGMWLLFTAAVVYLMVIVGGVTRLTQSGLSMVEWEPLMGVIPPLSLEEWQRVFSLYQASPEYQKINFGMSLQEFKGIFWWEYGHRVLGRLIGVIYFLPLLVFLLRGMIPKNWQWKLWGLFVLGGMQGVLGWYMVKSGLVDDPHVSQYRLTAHLGLAIVIFGFMWWFALSFLAGDAPRRRTSSRFKRFTLFAVAVVFTMILSGGFVAGTKAGFIMNTFPTMNGEWIPSGWLAMTPLWRNFFENAVTIQFTHRVLALVVVLMIAALAWKSRSENHRTGMPWLLALLLIQVTLGISALLLQVPVVLGAAHQAGAVALLAAALFVAHRARFSRQLSS